MRRIGNIFIIVLLVSILLVLTNPNKEQFVNWALKQAENNSQSGIEKLLGDVLGKPLIQLSTSRRDYLLFSIFTIDKGGNQGTFIGILKYIFIELK